MITHTAGDAIGAPDAFRFAGITYRQLDYWARRGWVAPSVEAGTGRPGRRLYSAADVVRLAALGHLGRSGADVGLLGPQVAALELPAGDVDYLVVLGPGSRLETVPAGDLRARLSGPGSYVIFDPAPLRRQLGLVPAGPSPTLLSGAKARTA